MADDDGPEVLDLGVVGSPDQGPDGADPAGRLVPTPEPARRGLSRRGLVALGGLAMLGAGVAAARAASTQPSAPPARAVPPPTSTGGPSPQGVGSGEVDVTELGGPLLGGRHADVFGFSNSAIVRIELATGRVTHTALPPLSDAPLTFAAVRGGAVVHRDDSGPGFLVPDGRPPIPLPRGLDGPGPLLPGPDLDHVWVLSGSGQRAIMVLTALDGRPTETAVELPAFTSDEPLPDGAGYPLCFGVGGVYWGRPRGLQRVTAGAVVASGPTGWLVLVCDARDRCSGTVDERTGRRRAVLGLVDAQHPVGEMELLTGALSPDGGRAALYVGDALRALRLVVLDVATGDRLITDLSLVEGAVSQSLAWTPDGHWLVAVDASARILAVDPATGSARPLVPGTIVPALPVVEQIAVRPQT
ncbi:MAG: TolB family protein [Kineosporiaceae bacterium]